jgi:hypothetical protein
MSVRTSLLPMAMACSLLDTGCAGLGSLYGGHKKPGIRPAASLRGQERVHESAFDPPLAIATEDDSVMRLVMKDATCTGTLIEDDLVLTAKHCVSFTDELGTSHLIEPSSIKVELGGDYIAWGRVVPKHIVAPPCGEYGGAGDLAILVLERKLVGVPTRKPRLVAAPHVGESVDPIGFGRCATSNGIHRVRREGGKIQSTTGETLQVVASICPGDSGGPVLSRDSGEILGVISMSAMDLDEMTKSPSVMARLDTYRDVFAYARAVADGEGPNELPPLSCKR